jgi:hypothetical protein
MINRIAWVVLLPIALDLFLWLGPRISIEPVAKQIMTWYTQQTAAALAAGSSMPLSPDQMREMVNEAASSFNFFSLLAMNIAGLPSYMVGQPLVRPAAAEIDSVLVLLALGIVLALAGLLPSAAFLVAIGQRVLADGLDANALRRHTIRVWLSLMALVVGGCLLVLAVAVPVSAILGVVLMISSGVGAVLVLLAGALVQVAFFAAIIYLFFLTDAIVISNINPYRAAWRSIFLVSRSFWSSISFIMISYVILMGTQLIWSRMVTPQIGPLPGILANAYIASGLTAASMLFYKDRLAWLERKTQ